MNTKRNKAVPASYLVLKKDGKILLTRRQGSGYYDGWYGLPAGHVEAGELPTECLIREAKEEIDVESTTTGTPVQQVTDTRPVIARYKVASKANFYSSPDENTLRSTFISQGDDKFVGALEDKNGFIYVVYTNDLGYVTRGWLSKKDLEKVD